ncbi:MAG: L-seryl-tRNA(Sec) selenium transferase [Dehalococcoidia bacterium]
MSNETSLRSLPSVDRVLAEPALAELLSRYRRDIVVEAIRGELAEARAAAAGGAAAPTAQLVAESVAAALDAPDEWPTRVINATGVVLHTNLGRAPLSDASVRAAARAGAGYSDLELDLALGKRGSRHTAVSALLQRLIGAEAAIVVNNNAGAMLLGLAAIAAGKQVVVSRGEASEIGGGFRIPDVLRQSGAVLTEVGTVNRTYAHDYERAIAPQTGALLVVHRSNFKVTGFTHEPELRDIARVAQERNVPLLHDLGSGALLNTADFGLPHEPMPQESLAAGAGLVFFSGDKLLGGPQAGIVVGTKDLVAKLSSHPLARALRADKLTLAALHATLLHYLRDEAQREVPIWRMISAPLEELSTRAEALARVIGEAASVTDGVSTVGGGSLPDDTMPSRLVQVDPSGVAGGADEVARRLRTGRPSIMARIDEGMVVLDLRTVLPAADSEVGAAVRAALE